MQWFLASGSWTTQAAPGSVTSSLDTVPVFVHLDIVVQNTCKALGTTQVALDTADAEVH